MGGHTISCRRGNNMSDIILFHFEQNEIRYVGDGVNHEWVAQDVFEAMGLKWNTDLIAEYDADEKGTTLIGTLGGEQKVLTLKQPGLYTAMLRSRNAMKPETLQYRFRKWITGEVIPAIAKNGEFSVHKDKLERQFMPTPTPKGLKEFHGLHKLMHGKAYADRWLQAKMKEYYPEYIGLPPAPEELPSLPVQSLLTPTEIAKELGITYSTGNPNPQWVNKKLEKLGYQEKIGGQWSATPKAAELCDRKPVDTNSRTQKDQLVWSANIIPILQEYVTAC